MTAVNQGIALPDRWLEMYSLSSVSLILSQTIRPHQLYAFHEMAIMQVPFIPTTKNLWIPDSSRYSKLQNPFISIYWRFYILREELEKSVAFYNAIHGDLNWLSMGVLPTSGYIISNMASQMAPWRKIPFTEETDGQLLYKWSINELIGGWYSRPHRSHWRSLPSKS